MPTEITGIVFYTVQEAAAELEVTAQTIRAWIKADKLDGRRIGRPILITEESLERFVREGAQANES